MFLWLEFTYLCQQSEQRADGKALQTGTNFSCSHTNCEFVSYFSLFFMFVKQEEKCGTCWLALMKIKK